jgi:predicted DCC family thiol-disulfide oxidoreductase YuxK
VVLFDGWCNLCNGWVDFVLRIDKEGVVGFSPLNSEAAQGLIARAGLLPETGDTVVLIDGDSAWTESGAALRVARLLPWPYRLLYALIVVPRPIRDAVYRLIARNRYRWFGQRQSCRVPSPEERERFL